MFGQTATRSLRRRGLRSLAGVHPLPNAPGAHLTSNSTRTRWTCQLCNGSSNQLRPGGHKGATASRSIRSTTRSLAIASDSSVFRDEATVIDGAATSEPGYPSYLRSRWPSSNALTEPQLTPTDPSDLIIVNDKVSSAAPRLLKWNGIGGDAMEMLQNLHACLRVGRLDRAAAVVRRLMNLYCHRAPELVHAHNIYLSELVENLYQTNSTVSPDDIHLWLVNEMNARRTPPDAITISLLLQSAFQRIDEEERYLYLKKYLNMAVQLGPDAVEHVLWHGDFTDSEIDALTQVGDKISNWRIKRQKTAESVVTADESVSLDQNITPSAAATRLMTVKPVEQKGLGLKTLMKTLDIFSAAKEGDSALESVVENEVDRLSELEERQLKLEENVVEAAVERWKEENEKMQQMGINPAVQSKTVSALIWQWHTHLKQSLEEELSLVRQSLSTNERRPYDERLQYGPYLESLTAEKLSVLCILTLIQRLTQVGITDGLKLVNATTAIGEQLEVEAQADFAKILEKKKRSAKFSSQQKRHAKMNRRYNVRGLSKYIKSDASAGDELVAQQRWPAAIRLKIGALLLSKLVEVARIPVTRTIDESGGTATQSLPAFHTNMVFRMGKAHGMIHAHPDLIAKLAKEPPRGLLAKRLPMLCPPKRWENVEEGGYIRYPVPVVRMKGADFILRHYVQAAVDKGDFNQIFEGLDILGQTPWKINRSVLSVILEAWNKGEEIGELAADNPKVRHPPAPDPSDIAAKARWRQKVRELENKKAGAFSQRCFQNFQLEIAKTFATETFYFPHNIDFRGRAYPVPPLLNHMGADMARSLLIFADGKELGHVGLRWLKIHLANLYGYDKASFEEREDFTVRHLDDIRESAVNPLGGSRWWLKAEDPWQCLGVCIELTKALDSSDPTRYVSCVPVHQDGTCNGLQHYAALGGDVTGAKQVNLEPGDRPADIYSGVAELVKEQVAKEAASGDKMALAVNGKITRKVVKQTVMTNVYGVTYVGAREQVRRQLEIALPDLTESDGIHYGSLSAYVAKHIFKALATMFSGAQKIQAWLGQCGSRIVSSVTPEQIEQLRSARLDQPGPENDKFKKKRRKKAAAQVDFRSPIIWTTPLKMPVVQPYRDGKVRRVSTVLQEITFEEPRRDHPVHKRKQLQGFPPNFIHSLDATHMILSALSSREGGITFAAVHDSFWTHAGDVPKMNRILREAFVRMHSEDIVGRLAEEFRARYKGCLYLAVMDGDKSLLEQIQTCRKAKGYSAAKGTTVVRNNIDELLEESDRQQLIQSEDPEEQRKGRDMVTAASIWEDAIKNTGAVAQEESEVQLLGETKGPPVVEELEEPATEANGKSKLKLKRKPKPSGGKVKIALWLPVTMPSLPEKGDFDVRRLMDSNYFFS